MGCQMKNNINEIMNCVNCKYFKPFYIKLFAAYSKTNRGYCMKSKTKKERGENEHICDCWEPNEKATSEKKTIIVENIKQLQKELSEIISQVNDL